MSIDDIKAAIVAWWLKQPPIQIAKTKTPDTKPLPDPPRFVDRYAERIDIEFDRQIKQIVVDVKNSPGYKKAGSL